MGWDWSFALYRYGPKWKFARRLFHHHFNNKVLPDFEPRQKKATYELLHRLAENPDNFLEHIRLYVLLVTMDASWN